jgi:4-hydroxy-tetrahydrodipicolinate reductase
MGTRLRELLPEQGELVLGAVLEDAANAHIGERLPQDVTLGTDMKHALATCDVAIDFSVPNATLALLHVALETRTALVIGTTGFEAAGRAAIVDAARSIPIVFAPNYSVAVNLLTHLVREAAARLGPDYDAEIVELHHAAKRDAPSGTALRLAEAVVEGRGTEPRGRFVSSRTGDTGARIPGSIGLQALRGGDNPGEHTVMFIGAGERIELSHRAMTRDHFVRGALRAAAWVAGRGPGLWDMGDVLGL